MIISSQVIEGMEVLRELKSVTRSSATSIASPSSESSHTNSPMYSHVDYVTSLAVISYKYDATVFD